MHLERKFLHPRYWYIELLFVAGIIAQIMSLLGSYWDLAWHFDFGRDTFWSPPHFLIYGSTALMAVAFSANFFIARKHHLSRRQKALFIFITLALIGSAIQYLSAPIDELWHRTYGIDVEIMSFPHLMLIAGGMLGIFSTIFITRYHIAHERRKYMIERILVPLFAGAFLVSLIFVFAESEFTTLPLWHPVQDRPLWMYPAFSMVFAGVVFITVRHLSPLPWAATLTFASYLGLRILPIIFNWAVGMKSIPVIPPFLPVLLAIALLADLTVRRR